MTAFDDGNGQHIVVPNNGRCNGLHWYNETMHNNKKNSLQRSYNLVKGIELSLNSHQFLNRRKVLWLQQNSLH